MADRIVCGDCERPCYDRFRDEVSLSICCRDVDDFQRAICEMIAEKRQRVAVTTDQVADWFGELAARVGIQLVPMKGKDNKPVMGLLNAPVKYASAIDAMLEGMLRLSEGRGLPPFAPAPPRPPKKATKHLRR